MPDRATNNESSPLRGLEIAASHGLSFDSTALEALPDSAFESFREDYLTWNERRDAAILRHLRETRTLFRVILPSSPRAYSLAKQLAWYLDEILLRDPVVAALTTDEVGPDQRQALTLSRLEALSSMVPAIQQGYLKLYGTPLAGTISKNPPDQVLRLVDDPLIRDSLRAELHCGRSEAVASDGSPVTVYQIALDAGGLVGFRTSNLVIAPYSSVTMPPVSPGERLPPIGYAELAGLIGNDPLDEIRTIVAREIQIPLLAAVAAARADAAVLFDRRAQSTILQRAEVALNPARQLASVQAFDLALPYVANLPVERLVELRASLPTAFQDFRAQMVAIVQEGVRAGLETPEELRTLVDARVLPIVRSLEGEVAATARRNRLLGYGSPAITAIGALTGGMLGLDPLAITTVLAASLAGSLKAAADSAESAARSAATPMYFLWRARQIR